MKRNIFLFVLSLVCTFLSAQTYHVSTEPQPKGVLLEEFTGIRCQYCPEGHVLGEQLKTVLGDQLSIVAIHSGRLAEISNPSLDFRVPAGEEISALLNVEGHGFPCGAVNRHNWNSDNDYIFGRYHWISLAQRVVDETAPVNLWAEAEYDAQTRQMKVKVEGFFTAGEVDRQQRLHIMVTQDHIIGYQKGAPYTDYSHEHMLRDALTTSSGEALTNCLPQTYFSRNYTYQVPETYGAIPVKAEDLELVIFVTGEDGRHVHNALTIHPVYQGATLPLKGILHADRMGITDDYIFPYYDVILENRSNTVLTSARFSMTLNDETLAHEWTGEIPAFSKQVIRIPADWQQGLMDLNVLTIVLQELNGQAVEPSTLTSSFSYTPLQLMPKELTLKHYTPDKVRNFTYTLYDLDYNTAQRFGPYEDEHYYEEKLQLNPGHRYCMEVKSRWGEGYMPVQNFLELCDADGTPLAVRDRITGFGFRLFFQTEGEMEPPLETCELRIKAYPYGIVRVYNDTHPEEEIRDETRTFTFNKGESVMMTFEPMARYHVESFQFNGVEMVDQLDGDYYGFNITGDTDVVVGFDYFGGTGIDEASENSCKLTSHDGLLNIEGLTPGQTVRIYTPAGQLVRQITPRQENVSIALEPQQLYMVSVAGRNFKLFVH